MSGEGQARADFGDPVRFFPNPWRNAQEKLAGILMPHLV